MLEVKAGCLGAQRAGALQLDQTKSLLNSALELEKQLARILAVERGGNIEGAEAGKVATVEGVSVIGLLNLPGRIAASASLLYAKNLLTFFQTLVDKESGAININREDELVAATLLTHEGAVVHPKFGGTVAGGEA